MKPAAALAFTLSLAVTPALGHGAHHAATQAESTSRIEQPIPNVMVRDQTGGEVALDRLLGNLDETLVLTFTYTNCTSLCPVVVPQAMKIAHELDDAGQETALVVMTIDPERDGLAEMALHADNLDARDDDRFLSGAPADIFDALRVFGIGSGNLEEHPGLIVVRHRGSGEFIRIVVGNAGTERLMELVRNVGG